MRRIEKQCHQSSASNKRRGREQFIWAITLRYGLADGVPRSLDEVGELLGISKQAVHRYFRGISDFQTLCDVSTAISFWLISRKEVALLERKEELEANIRLLNHLLELENKAETEEDWELVTILGNKLGIQIMIEDVEKESGNNS